MLKSLIILFSFRLVPFPFTGRAIHFTHIYAAVCSTIANAIGFYTPCQNLATLL